MERYPYVEFVCVNPGVPGSTPAAKAADLYGRLKVIPGLLILRQDFSEEAGHLAMLAYVLEDEGGALLSIEEAASRSGVGIDLVRDVGAETIRWIMDGTEDNMIDAYVTSERRHVPGRHGLPFPEETGWAVSAGGKTPSGGR